MLANAMKYLQTHTGTHTKTYTHTHLHTHSRINCLDEDEITLSIHRVLPQELIKLTTACA